MIAYVKGTLEMKFDHYIVIDVSGIGYKVYMAENAIEKVGELGQVIKVHTHYHVREDDISLYGFNTNEELKMFELLINVSGVGAKSAMNMLAHITPSSFALAVITDNLVALTQIPGIGAKSAQRIILELKDKLKTQTAISKTAEIKEAIQEENKQSEAVAALQVLGYNKKEIERVLEKIEEIEKLSVENIIKKALFMLGK